MLTYIGAQSCRLYRPLYEILYTMHMLEQMYEELIVLDI